MARVSTKKLLLLGFLIGLVAVPVLTATFSSSDAGNVSDGVSIGAPDGMNVTLTGQTDVKMENLFDGSDTVNLTTEAGNITFNSTGPAWATVHTSNITGTYTNVTDIDGTSNTITADPEDKQAISFGEDIDNIAWKDNIQTDDNTIDFVYGGSSGESNVTVYNVAANENIRAIDANSNNVLDSGKSDSNGVLVLNNLTNSQHAVQLQTFTPAPPELDNSTMSPDGDTVRRETVTLSIGVSDGDFPQDNVTLEWYVDGSLANTTYATSNGTYSAKVGPFSDGSHTWRVNATDQYGEIDNSTQKTFSIDHYDPVITDIKPAGDQDNKPSQIEAQINDTDFATDGDTVDVDIILDGTKVNTQTVNSNTTITESMPSRGQTGGKHTINITANDSYGNNEFTTELQTYTIPDTFFVRNETNHSQLVGADGEVRFFADNKVYSRSAPNGKLNMTGLPVDETFIVEVDPTSNDYTKRTIYIENIYVQQSAYVLNKSKFDVIQSRFVLDDPTGQYGSQSLLKIRKPINISGTVQYQSIIVDKFGAEGVTALLQKNQRYKLAVDDGQNEQTVGPYRATVNETVAVEPGPPTINLSTGSNEWVAVANLTNRTLEYGYNDPSQKTDDLVIYIHERGNESNLLQPNITYTDIGTATGKLSLTKNESQKEWVVKFVITRDGETFVTTDRVSKKQDATPPVDSNWTVMFAIASLILLAGAFSVLNASIGAIIVSLSGGMFWWLGFLDGAASAASISIALMISVLGHIYTKR